MCGILYGVRGEKGGTTRVSPTETIIVVGPGTTGMYYGVVVDLIDGINDKTLKIYSNKFLKIRRV